MKVLYLSCHEVLEYDELRLFHELGIEVFALGSYLHSARPSNLRPALGLATRNADDLAAFEAFGRNVDQFREALPRSFVDRFDAVMIMHEPAWVCRNWTAIRHKRVVWRTIGQSWPSIELGMQWFRDRGLKIVRYSPCERSLPNFAGEDAVIRFYKDPREYGSWSGERQTVISVAHGMPLRPIHCDYELFRQVTGPFPCELYGADNELAGRLNRGLLTYDQLRETLRRGRVFFYTGSKPASYTLGFIEAWMTGIPIVALGPYYGNSDVPGREVEGKARRQLYEVADLITDGEDGFVGDDVARLQAALELMLSDESHAKQISERARDSAVRYFGKETIKPQWQRLFDSLS